MKNVRDSSIELYRCLMMFGIVFIHCAYCSIGSFTWENVIGRWCVDGFVLISGFYGIRHFSFAKIVKLYLTMAFLAFYVSVIAWMLGWNRPTLIELIGIINGYWFVHAYVIVMLLAPIINAAAEREDRKKLLFPFIMLVLLWGLVTELPIIGKVIWKTPGVGSFSGLTMAAVYAVGRICRLDEWDKSIRPVWALCLLPILFAITCIGIRNGEGVWVQGWLGNYASPFSVAIAVLIFILFKRIELPSWLGWVCLFVAASMFPVYIIHGHPACFQWMSETIGQNLSRFPTIGVLLVVSVIVFAGSVILDMPRLVIAVLCRSREYFDKYR